LLQRAPSLRFRLTLWYVGVFFVLQVVLLGTVAILRRSASVRADQIRLEADARQIIENVITARAFTSEELRLNVPTASEMLFVFLRDEKATILASKSPAEGFEPSFEPREQVPVGPVGPTHTSLPPSSARAITGRDERLVMLTYPFRYEGELFYLQTAAKDRGLVRYLGPFVDLVVIGVPVGILAAMAAAWMITDRALRPLDRLAAAARAVSPARLGTRLPASGDAEFLKLAAELNSALARIEAAYNAQDQFLGNVAHELKTPLAVLLLQAQVAKIGARKDADAWAFLQAAEEELKRLSGVVESFLVLARARAAGPDRPRERISLHDLVVQAVHNGKRQAEERGVRLIANLEDEGDSGRDTNAEEPVLAGDSELLQTMLDNLVRNAVAHSPEGEVVAIDAGRDGHDLWLAVRDRGPGIPPEYREQIFERFVQVPAGTVKDGEKVAARRGAGSGGIGSRGVGLRGTGLGLAIAHDVARMHGGRIGIEDREGGGTSMLVVLPESDASDAQS
jgi:signal transduction histidine kinase